MKIKKLDRRMNGHENFKYGVDFSFSWAVGSPRFDEVRQWMWETFGASTELDIWETRKDHDETPNPKWAWDRGQFNKTFRCIIYLQDDQVANWFKLRWGTE